MTLHNVAGLYNKILNYRIKSFLAQNKYRLKRIKKTSLKLKTKENIQISLTVLNLTRQKNLVHDPTCALHNSCPAKKYVYKYKHIQI
jgi:hypothetical protein